MSVTDGWDRFWALYRSGAWEPHTREVINRFCGPGKLFVDVGAWIGPTVLWALETGADVVAVEPDPVAYEKLTQTLAGRRVELWQCAVAATAGTGVLGRNPKDGGEFGDSMSRLTDGDGHPVTVRTLQQIVDERRPALVKVDIEGGEVDLLPAIVPWLRGRGAALQVSFHGTLADRALFDGWSQVDWPAGTWGDLVAVP